MCQTAVGSHKLLQHTTTLPLQFRGPPSLSPAPTVFLYPQPPEWSRSYRSTPPPGSKGTQSFVMLPLRLVPRTDPLPAHTPTNR